MKKSAKKRQGVFLVVAITVLLIAGLFVLRTYLAEKYGIFAAVGTETLHQTVSVSNGQIREGYSVLTNVKIVGSKAVLDDPSQPGSVEGWITNYDNNNLSKFTSSTADPPGCNASEPVLKIKYCEAGDNSTVCENDWRTDGTRNFTPSEQTSATFIRWKVELAPCQTNAAMNEGGTNG